jgi:hypothetical protein
MGLLLTHYARPHTKLMTGPRNTTWGRILSPVLTDKNLTASVRGGREKLETRINQFRGVAFTFFRPAITSGGLRTGMTPRDIDQLNTQIGTAKQMADGLIETAKSGYTAATNPKATIARAQSSYKSFRSQPVDVQQEQVFEAIGGGAVDLALFSIAPEAILARPAVGGITRTAIGGAAVETAPLRILRSSADDFVSAPGPIVSVSKPVGRAKVDLVPLATKTLGEWGEARLSSLLGGQGIKPSTPFKTPTGVRYPDRLVNRISYESKAGLNVKLTSSIEKQIAKDAYLIESGQIRGAEWHFWRGARPELVQALKDAGIKPVVH